MPVVTDKKNWEISTQAKNQEKGPLVKVEIYPGKIVKMYQKDAIEAGYLKPKTKKAPPGENKIIKPGGDKGSSGDQKNETENEADDFRSISGIGPATARALIAHGVESFEELLQLGELNYLTAGANKAIEKWRENFNG